MIRLKHPPLRRQLALASALILIFGALALALQDGALPQSLRRALCLQGHYFGIRPVKLPNRMLAWPAESIERLLSGEKAES